jgi:hypothetical protein
MVTVQEIKELQCLFTSCHSFITNKTKIDEWLRIDKVITNLTSTVSGLAHGCK